MWTTLALNLLASLFFLLVVAAVGARLRPLLRVPLPPGLKLAIDVVLGNVTLAILVTALGLCHLWKQEVILAVLSLLVLLGRWRRSQWRLQSLLGSALAALLLVPLALAPPFFYDALVYHLSQPWQWYLEGGMSAHPESIFTALPPLFSCLSAFFLPWGWERAPAMLHLLQFVVAGSTMFWTVRSFGANKITAHASAFCLPLVPLFVLVPALPAAEGFAVIAVVPALALVLAKTPIPGSVPLGGILLGAAIAARLQVLPMVVLLGLALAWRRKPGPGAAGAALLGFLTASSPWWLKNWVLLGQPLLPFGWQGAGLVAAWRDSVSTMHTGKNLVDFLRPLGSDLGPHAGYLLPLFLAGLLGARGGGNWRWRVLGLILVGGLVAWDVTAAVPRYLAPWAPVLLVWATLAGKRPAGHWATYMALAATACLGVLATFSKLQRFGGVSLTLESKARLIQRLEATDPFPVFAVANKLLPKDAKVLFVGEPRGFGFPRRFVAPSYLDEPELARVTEELDSPNSLVKWLQNKGFTHLLVNWGELHRLAPGYPAEPWRTPMGRQHFLTLIRELSPPLVQFRGVCLYIIEKQRV